MQKALSLWNKGNNTDALTLFESIAATEKTNWLPYYYVALISTREAFKSTDKEQMDKLLAKAQTAQDAATALESNNEELLVTQALIHTARIVADPMVNGRKLFSTVNQLYEKALAMAPGNPRVVLSKAQFDMGASRYMGADTESICSDMEQAVALFATFKPQSAYHPDWGKEKAEEELKKCKK